MPGEYSTDPKDVGMPDLSVKPTRKRKRVVISCTECHRRKQKCDRTLPCSNCITRNKQSACHYETEFIVPKRHSVDFTGNLHSSEDGSRSPSSGAAFSVQQMRIDSDSTAQFGAFGYAKHGHNSLGIFKKIESYDRDGPPMDIPTTVEYSGLRHKYKDLVRQLPPRPFVERLCEIFFHEANWHYYPVDEEIFQGHLQNWYNISFSILNKGPQELPPDLRFFPALLFQMLALALQFQPPGQDSSFDSLKYASDMSLDDLASDYSESGSAILSLLGKHNMTIATIQAGFLRTAFLKNSAMVIESWHSLGQSIRDAQEMGWHRDGLDRSPTNSETAIDRLWLVELKKRLWAILQLWDAHTALVLGRQSQIDNADERGSMLPIDAPRNNHKGSPPYPRTLSEPPTPLTSLIATSKMMLTVRETLALEKKGAHPKDYSRLEAAHKQLLQKIDDIPACFRSVNPDTTFDAYPQCHWLPASRLLFDTLQGFIMMTLHRPYAFTNPNSRVIALEAGLNILRAQRRLFLFLQAKHYKLFNLVLSTFDAIVLVAAIYILHPTESPERLNDALQHFEWAMERFEVMSDRNQMAKAGVSVLKAIHPRLMKAIGRQEAKEEITFSATQTRTPSVQSLRHNMTETSSSIESPNYPNHGLPQPFVLSGPAESSERSSQIQQQPQMQTTPNIQTQDNSGLSTYPMESWDSVPTGYSPLPQAAIFEHKLSFSDLQPTADLLWDGLIGMTDDQVPMGMGNNGTPAGGQIYYPVNSAQPATMPWQFEGEFSGNSFWNFMNQYN